MTNEEIIKGNKLIAEFMGAKMIVDDWDGISLIRFPDESTKHLGALKYNSSWDQLMEAVEKIEKNCWIIITTRVSKTTCAIYQPYKEFEIISRGDSESKIEAVWVAVVEFIKWYNEKNKNNEDTERIG